MTVPSKLSGLFDQYSFLSQNTPNSTLLPAQMDLEPLINQFEEASFLPLALQCLESTSLPEIRLIRSIRAKLQQYNVISQTHAVRQSSYQIVQFPEVIPVELIMGPRQEANMEEQHPVPEDLAIGAPPFLLGGGDHPASFRAVFLTQLQQQREIAIGYAEWRLKTLKAIAEDCAQACAARERERQLKRAAAFRFEEQLQEGSSPIQPLLSSLITSTCKAITDTLACSSIYSELVSSNLRQKQIAQRLLNELKPTEKSHALEEASISIQKRKIRGVLVDVFEELPFSGPQQKFNATLPNNKPAERAALVFALSALRLRERMASVRIPEPGGANLLIKQFLEYNNKKTGVLISAGSYIKSLDFPRNVRIFPFNRLNMRNTSGNEYEMYQFNNENIRVNFYGERKAEENFDLVDLDLVTVDFEYMVKCKKIDFSAVLKELGKSEFDFAIVNRFDSFRSQRKLKYMQLFDLRSDFVLNILGDTGPLRNFAAACLSAKFDPDILSHFEPEILEGDLISDESLLKKLEKASQDYLESHLLTFEASTRESKATTETLVIDCGEGSDLECLRQMRALFKDNDESDLRTQITTELNRINTQTSDVEEESEENTFEMIKVVRNNLISYHGQQQVAPENVAECLKGDTTYPCAEAVLQWLDTIELRERSGVRIPGLCFRDMIIRAYGHWEWLEHSITKEFSVPLSSLAAFSLSAEKGSDSNLSEKIFETQVETCNYDSYRGPLGIYGRSLGIFLQNDVLERIGVKSVEERREQMVHEYNERVMRERLQFCGTMEDWRFLEEYIKTPSKELEYSSTSRVSLLENSDDMSVISQVGESQLGRYDDKSFICNIKPDFYWQFKFTGFFSLMCPQDIEGNTYTFFFTLRDDLGELEPEFLELDNTDFSCQYFPFFSTPHPNILAREILEVVNSNVVGRRYAVINDHDGSLQEELQNYKAKLHVMRDLIDNAYTDVMVLPGDMQSEIIENLEDLSGRIERIYEIRIKAEELAENEAIACCEIIYNSLDAEIKEKVQNYIKSQKFSESLAKPSLNAANCLETVDFREKAVSEEYFKYNYIEKQPTMVARRFVENVYDQFCEMPEAVAYSESYEEMLVSLQQRIYFGSNSCFGYLSTEADKKARVATPPLLFGFCKVEPQNVLSRTGNGCCFFPISNSTVKSGNFISIQHSNVFERLRIALNPFAHNKLYSQVDIRRDNYEVLISVPVFIETTPFKRFLCPRCCIYNDLWSTCFHLIEQCARVSLPQSRCRAEGNFMFPDIYFYNSYMHLYRGSIQSIISSDISTIILIMQITKENKDYIQHTINEKLINMIFSQFAEPVSNTCNPVVLQTKLVVQSAFAQSARVMRSYPAVQGVHEKLTLRQTHLLSEFELKMLKNLRNARQLTYLQIAEGVARMEQQKISNSSVSDLMQPIIGHMTQFAKDELKCDLVGIAELSQAPMRAVQFENNFAEYAQAVRGCLRATSDFNNCVEIVTRNHDSQLDPPLKDQICLFEVKRMALADEHQNFDIL